MKHNLLLQHHLMIGRDWHDSLLPGGVPKLVDPHACIAHLQFLIWGWTGTAKGNEKVLNLPSRSWVMTRGTDIGPFIPQIPGGVDLIWWLYTLTSASKSEFGANTVKAPLGPVAVAVLGGLNLNLNCHGAVCPPLTTGVVFADNTVAAGMTWGDIFAGFTTAAMESLIQFGLNKFFGSLGSQAAAAFGNTVAANIVANVVMSVASTFLPAFGSPLGYSPSYTTIGSKSGEFLAAYHDRARDGFDRLLNHLGVDDFPEALPAPATP